MPQPRKYSPISIGLLWQINALLICIIHKPWAVCKRTLKPLTWWAVSLAQVRPNLPREDVMPFLWHVERIPVWSSWGKQLALIMTLLLTALKQGGLEHHVFPVHHFVRYVGTIVFASFFHTEMPVLWLSSFFYFCYRIIRWPSTAVSARPVSSREFFVAQKGNTFYSLHETFIVNVYYSETLYCTIKLVLSKLLDVHVFELLSTG